MPDIPTLKDIRGGVVRWVREDLKRASLLAAVSFAISWGLNYLVISTRGESFGNLVAGSTTGNEFWGALYWAIVGLVISGLIAYGIEAGWAELRSGLKSVPVTVRRLFREHGFRMWSVITWGCAMSLLVAGALAPTVSAALGIGVVAFAPTAITSIVGRVLTKAWVAVVGALAPARKPLLPGVGGQLVAVTGGAIGFIAASQIAETGPRLIGALVLAVISHLILVNGRSPAVKAAAFVLFGLAFWVGLEGVAVALSGCCGGHVETGATGMRLAAIGGGAAGVTGVIGAGLGTVLGRNPLDPRDWDDPGTAPGPGWPPSVTDHPLPDGPTTAVTLALLGTEAMAARKAFDRASRQGKEADIPLPDSEQWSTHVAGDDGTVIERTGFVGSRARIKSIEVTGEGDEASATVDALAYLPPGTTSPAEISRAAAGAEAAVSDVEVTPPEPEPEGDPEIPAEPADDSPDGPPTWSSGGTALDDGGQMPDGSDATAFSRWLGVAAERRIPNKDVRALERLIRGDSDQARLSGTLEAPADALEIVDRSDGIAIGFPDGDRILIRAHKGRLQVRHEGGLPTGAPPPGPPGLPPAPQITANTGPAVEAFNRSLASTGRRLASIDRLPSGEVRIQVSR